MSRRPSLRTRAPSSVANAFRASDASGIGRPKRQSRVSTSVERRKSAARPKQSDSGCPTAGGMTVMAGLVPHFGPVSGSLSFGFHGDLHGRMAAGEERVPEIEHVPAAIGSRFAVRKRESTRRSSRAAERSTRRTSRSP